MTDRLRRVARWRPWPFRSSSSSSASVSSASSSPSTISSTPTIAVTEATQVKSSPPPPPPPVPAQAKEGKSQWQRFFNFLRKLNLFFQGLLLIIVVYCVRIVSEYAVSRVLPFLCLLLFAHGCWNGEFDSLFRLLRRPLGYTLWIASLPFSVVSSLLRLAAMALIATTPAPAPPLASPAKEAENRALEAEKMWEEAQGVSRDADEEDLSEKSAELEEEEEEEEEMEEESSLFVDAFPSPPTNPPVTQILDESRALRDGDPAAATSCQVAEGDVRKRTESQRRSDVQAVDA